MAKSAKKANKQVKKKRAEQYEPKVKFEGTLEEMLKISATGAGVKREEKKGE